MTPFSLQPKVEVLYEKFSNKPYVPREHWTTEREFKLDHQPTPAEFVSDPQFEKQQHEFVLDNVFGGSRRDRTAHT